MGSLFRRAIEVFGFELTPTSAYGRMSYSQFGEDVIIEALFMDLGILKPAYLDVGAYHPIYLNNTYLFYRKGCAGVCLEPDPDLFKVLRNRRKRDTCLNVGVGPEKRRYAEFYVMSSKGLNTFSKQFAERQYRKIQRRQWDRCWCGGELLPFKWHESYGVCANCGSYVNRRPPVREDLEKLYTLDLYWRTRQQLRVHPAIEDRAAYYRSDGRLDYWLHLVEKYGPSSGRVIEIDCAPGVLLEALSNRGYECEGIEISSDVAEWIRQRTGLNVYPGFFPGADLSPCHLFLAFDVLEHSPCPEDFVREISNVLYPGGIAIIQTAIDRYDYEPPFGRRFDMFDDLEHLFLFTDKAMGELAKRSQLEIVSLDERLCVAGEVCILRKP